MHFESTSNESRSANIGFVTNNSKIIRLKGYSHVKLKPLKELQSKSIISLQQLCKLLNDRNTIKSTII